MRASRTGGFRLVGASLRPAASSSSSSTRRSRLLAFARRRSRCRGGSIACAREKPGYWLFGMRKSGRVEPALGGASETGGEFKKFMAILATASGVATVPCPSSSPLGVFPPAACPSRGDCGSSTRPGACARSGCTGGTGASVCSCCSRGGVAAWAVTSGTGSCGAPSGKATIVASPCAWAGGVAGSAGGMLSSDSASEGSWLVLSVPSSPWVTRGNPGKPPCTVRDGWLSSGVTVPLVLRTLHPSGRR